MDSILNVIDFFSRPYYWWYRRQNGYPCVAEFESVLRGKALGQMTIRKSRVIVLYLYGHSLEEIAKDLNVTRERVRQIILKIWRDNK